MFVSAPTKLPRCTSLLRIHADKYTRTVTTLTCSTSNKQHKHHHHLSSTKVAVSSREFSVLAQSTPCVSEGSLNRYRRRRRVSTTTEPRYHSTVFATSRWNPSVPWNEQKDTFLASATLEEKEAWLEEQLLTTTSTTTTTTTDGKGMDHVEAVLVVLRALATSDHPAAPRRAEKWLIRLKDLPDVEIPTEAYQAVIESWANCSKEHPLVVVNRSEKWLHEALDESEIVHHDKLQPTIGLYNAYLDACTRGRSGRNKKNHDIVSQNALRADAVLRRLVSEYHHFGETAKVIPTTESFNYVIRGWTRCRFDEAAHKKVISLLRLMESYQRENPLDSVIKPDTKSYAMVMSSLAEEAKQKSYNCSRSSRGNMGDSSKNGIDEMHEAEAILRYMHDLHDAGVEGVSPNRIPYNILITGWAGLAANRHHDAPFRAEETLRRMSAQQSEGIEEVGPDRVSYEKVMLAWGNSDRTNGGHRANWWLKKLWNDVELHNRPELTPTTQTYNIVIRALGKTEGALAAENLLLDMGDKYREKGDKSLCPNSESFSIVIKAWLNESHQHRGMEQKTRTMLRAVDWLTSLYEIENENNLSTAPELYHGVLRQAKACARRRPEILEVANATFERLRDSRHSVDALSYAWLLGAGLEALSEPEYDVERTEFIENLITSCCDDGYLSNRVVQALVNSRVEDSERGGWTLKKCEETVEKVFHSWPIPASWTRNLKSESFLPKKFHLTRSKTVRRPHHNR